MMNGQELAVSRREIKRQGVCEALILTPFPNLATIALIGASQYSRIAESGYQHLGTLEFICSAAAALATASIAVFGYPIIRNNHRRIYGTPEDRIMAERIVENYFRGE